MPLCDTNESAAANASPTGGLLRRRRATLALVLLAAVLAGCAEADPPADDAGSDDAGSEEVSGAPAWVREVHPAPGAETTGLPEVQVSHEVVGTREDVRLVIDGIDVTQYAGPGQGVLTYKPGDGDEPRAPVELSPGTHRAVVQRVLLPEFGETYKVLDSFGWQFTVQ